MKRSIFMRSLCWSAIGAISISPLAAAAQGGTISGKVEATPAKFLAETVVYIKEAKGTFPKKTEAMDQKGMQFSPHVMAVTVGDTVQFQNHDGMVHDVYTTDGEAYDLGTFDEGQTRPYTFQKTGTYAQLCSIHPEMLGYIFVGQNPYHAVVDSSGNYTIRNVPAGTYQLVVWNSKLKAAEQTITVAEGKTAQANFSLKR